MILESVPRVYLDGLCLCMEGISSQRSPAPSAPNLVSVPTCRSRGRYFSWQSGPPAGPRKTAPLNYWPALMAPDFLLKRKQSPKPGSSSWAFFLVNSLFPHSREQKNQFPGFRSLSGNSKVWKANSLSGLTRKVTQGPGKPGEA